jgi:hypothetical protein
LRLAAAGFAWSRARTHERLAGMHIFTALLRKLADWLEPTPAQLEATHNFLMFGDWLR